MPILNGEEVLVGENYLVRGRRGCWRHATVLDKRRGESGSVELYVHFDGDDRRLDHWLDSSRLKFRNQTNKRITPVYEMREKRMRKAKENSPNTTSLDYSEVLEEQHIEVTKVKYIEVVRYGEFEMDTWYVSPYPDEYGKERYLFICDKCFLYMRQERAFKMHLSTCNAKHPPGREIYVDSAEKIAVYEVDGEKEKLFCQCLCLFAKLFMDHKTIYFDVTTFLFYVVCQLRDSGYELSRREGIQGSPEKPLSDLGAASFHHYWAYIIVDYLSGLMDTAWIRVSELAKSLGMQAEDVVDTLHWLQLCDPKVMSEAPDDYELWESAATPLVNGTVTESSTVDSGSEAVAEGSSVGSATAAEVEVDKNKSASSQPAEEPESDNRTFTVTGLRHPGGWRTHSEIINMLARCDSFNIRFGRATKQKGPKPGSISFTFESISSARESFTQAQKMRVDGQAVKVEACPAFCNGLIASSVAPAACRSRPFFKIPVDEEAQKRTIYALDLPISAEQNLLNSIFEADHIEKITFLPLRNQHKQAEVVMHTEEQVEAARSEDGFELDDGQQQSVLRILTPVEYAKFVEEEQKPIPFVPPEIEPPPAKEPPNTTAQPTASAPADAKLAPVLDEDDVTDMFIKYVTDQRVNWAEITDVMELYTMCDAVSAQIGGLPDSVLRPAMLHTLQRHLTEAQSAWMREHLQDLIKGWKQEVRRDAFVDRPTLVQMKAAEYVPVAPSRKRLRGRNSAESRAGRVMMGVGALLEAQRQKMITEEGELEVEEDEQGNIMLGGEALSFESWAKQSQKEWKEKRMGAKKMRIMQQAREELEALDKDKQTAVQAPKSKDVENGKDKKEVEKAPPKPPKEWKIAIWSTLIQCILTSWMKAKSILKKSGEKRKEKKRSRRKASSSSNSSSTSSSSESDDDGDARKRRRNRRKTERLKGPQVPPLFQRMFNYRHEIINALSAEHKTAFASVLHQVLLCVWYFYSGK
ncbi:MOZ/SAS family protein [Ostertagia ostertagi]